MSRGTAKKIGEQFENANGYTYEKTLEGWLPVHKLIAEQKLGRKLKPEERATFKDGNRRNFSPDNIIVIEKYSKQSLQAKLVRVEENIRELEAQRDELRQQIAKAKQR